MRKCTQCQVEQDDSAYHSKYRKVCKCCTNNIKKEKQKQYDETANSITRTCKICQEVKVGTCFRYDMHICRECVLQRQNRVANKPTEDMPPKQCSKCMEVQNAIHYRYRTNVCKECEKKDLYEWRKNNPQKFQEHLQKYRSTEEYKENRRTDLRFICRNRIRMALKKEYKAGSTPDLIGCSIEYLKDWIEHNFDDNMSWKNFGTYWHIDHITPCASFDLSSVENQKACFNWSNMAPLEKKQNLIKRDKIDIELIRNYQQKACAYISTHPLY